MNTEEVKLAPPYDWRITLWKGTKALLLFVASAAATAALQYVATALTDPATVASILGPYGGGAVQALILSGGVALQNYLKNRGK